jgi:hypothetical protein
MKETSKKSLRNHVLESIESFLYKEGFEKDDVISKCILEAINLISDYHEEGIALFPEMIITNNLNFFRTIPNKEIVIGEEALSIDEFKKAVKLTAPLAIDSWIIFAEIFNGKIKYGLVTAEMTENSISIYDQTVGALKIELDNITIAYIRNIKKKTVELSGLKKKMIVSLTLEEDPDVDSNEIKEVSAGISRKCHIDYKNKIANFFEKNLVNILRNGHGNLIGIIDNGKESISALQQSEKTGTFLACPINFSRLIQDSEEQKSNESSTALKAYLSIMKAMINHDGITVFTNDGKLVGYHLILSNYELNADEINTGGARTKAFNSMKNSGLFLFCFYKSQDGSMKTWSSNE